VYACFSVCLTSPGGVIYEYTSLYKAEISDCQVRDPRWPWRSRGHISNFRWRPSQKERAWTVDVRQSYLKIKKPNDLPRLKINKCIIEARSNKLYENIQKAGFPFNLSAQSQILIEILLTAVGSSQTSVSLWASRGTWRQHAGVWAKSPAGWLTAATSCLNKAGGCRLCKLKHGCNDKDEMIWGECTRLWSRIINLEAQFTKVGESRF